jgi:hypothetical protein
VGTLRCGPEPANFAAIHARTRPRTGSGDEPVRRPGWTDVPRMLRLRPPALRRFLPDFEGPLRGVRGELEAWCFLPDTPLSETDTKATHERHH